MPEVVATRILTSAECKNVKQDQEFPIIIHAAKRATVQSLEYTVAADEEVIPTQILAAPAEIVCYLIARKIVGVELACLERITHQVRVTIQRCDKIRRHEVVVVNLRVHYG